MVEIDKTHDQSLSSIRFTLVFAKHKHAEREKKTKENCFAGRQTSSTLQRGRAVCENEQIRIEKCHVRCVYKNCTNCILKSWQIPIGKRKTQWDINADRHSTIFKYIPGIQKNSKRERFKESLNILFIDWRMHVCCVCLQNMRNKNKTWTESLWNWEIRLHHKGK